MQIFVTGSTESLRRPLAESLAESLGRPFAQMGAEGQLDAPADAIVLASERGLAAADVRHAAVQDGIVVSSVASPADLAARFGGSARAWACETSDRAERDREAHLVVGPDARGVASRVEALVDEAPVLVPLGARSYLVEIGAGIRARLSARVDAHSRGDVLLIHDGPERPWVEEAREGFAALGRKVVDAAFAPGEAQKHVETVVGLWDAGLAEGLDRGAFVVGVGGGVVGDMAAFVASTYLRGVSLGQLPTTLLSMVDSSVGGKTGFNTRHGKNLVGTFYQPRFVLCDVETLDTLPDAERIAGLAEVVKSAWLDGESSVAALEADADALLAGDPEATLRAVRMSVRLKARVVMADEREAGQRMWLNLGHTVGHALEADANYRGLRHGEAVALGMIASLRVAEHLGEGRAEDEARLVGLLTRLGLPTDLDARLKPNTLGYIANDKKRRGDQVRFVVPRAPGATAVVPLDITTIEAAVRRE